jgi:hypothetical protein
LDVVTPAEKYLGNQIIALDLRSVGSLSHQKLKICGIL